MSGATNRRFSLSLKKINENKSIKNTNKKNIYYHSPPVAIAQGHFASLKAILHCHVGKATQMTSLAPPTKTGKTKHKK